MTSLDLKRVAAMRDQLKWLREQHVELIPIDVGKESMIEGSGDNMAYRPEAYGMTDSMTDVPRPANFDTQDWSANMGPIDPIEPITGHQKLIDVQLTEPQIVMIVDVLRNKLRYELDRATSDAVDELEDLIHHMKCYRG